MLKGLNKGMVKVVLAAEQLLRQVKGLTSAWKANIERVQKYSLKKVTLESLP